MENMTTNTDATNGMTLDGHAKAQMPALERDIETSGEQAVLQSVMLLGALHKQEGREFDIDAFVAGVKTYYLAHKDEQQWADGAKDMLREAKDNAGMFTDGNDGSGADDRSMDPSKDDIKQLLAALGITPSDDAAHLMPDNIRAELEALGDGGVGDDDDVDPDDDGPDDDMGDRSADLNLESGDDNRA